MRDDRLPYFSVGEIGLRDPMAKHEGASVEMKKRNARMALLLGAGAATGLMALATCNDYMTGQDPEPPGPLLVTRLYLFDASSRDVPVATDTAAPVDCESGPERETTACTGTPFKDKFGVRRSQPTPDSVSKLRVVFNKLPLKLGGKDIETVPEAALPKDASELSLIDPNVIKLECVPAESCTGIPATHNSLQVTGSSLSPDPGDPDYSYPFGPALQMELDPADDPLASLEPGTTYRVVVDPALSGRNSDDKVLLDERARGLLSFTTEPFKLLALGDTWVYAGDGDADGSTNKPYLVKVNDAGYDDNGMVYDLSPRGAIRVRINASADLSTVTPGLVSASVSINGASSVPVPVQILLARVSQDGDDKGLCAEADKRLRNLYILPQSGNWAPGRKAGESAVVTLSLHGAQLRDVSQAAGHPAGQGKHTLGSDIYFQAAVLESEPTGYGGPTTDDVKTAAQCAALTAPPADMATTADMSTPPDMSSGTTDM